LIFTVQILIIKTTCKNHLHQTFRWLDETKSCSSSRKSCKWGNPALRNGICTFIL